MIEAMSKGTVEWGGRRITIEGPSDFVAAELDRFRTSSGVPPETNAAGTGGADRPITDVQFLAQKMPQDHYERVAVLAVRLKETGKPEFNSDEMRKAYLRAGIKPPKAMQQALIDTKRKKDYIESSKVRGSYQLTSFGEDFVRFDLPKSDGRKR